MRINLFILDEKYEHTNLNNNKKKNQTPLGRN